MVEEFDNQSKIETLVKRLLDERTSLLVKVYVVKPDCANTVPEFNS